MTLPRRVLAAATLLALVAGGVVVVLLPVSPHNVPLVGRDSGVFLYTGWRILNGEVPYRDVWDHKPPLIFFLNAAGLALAGGSRWGVWFIEVLSLSAAVCLSFRVLEDAFGALAASLATSAWLLTMPFVLQGGNFTEEYALPLQFGALWLACRGEKCGAYSWRGYMLGLLAGLTFFTKQNTIGIDLVILLWMAYRALSTSGPHRSRRVIDIYLFLGGAMTVSIIVVGYFAFHHALFDFWDAAFQYNAIYCTAGNPGKSIGSMLTNGRTALSAVGLPVFGLVGWGVGLGWVIRRGDRTANPRSTFLLRLAVIGLPLELALASTSGRLYWHYYTALLPVLAVLMGFLVHVLQETVGRVLPRGSKVGRDLLSLSIVLAAAAALMPTFRIYRPLARSLKGLQNADLVSYIQHSTSPDSYLLMFGQETAYNFSTLRRSPSRFAYQTPLFQTGYANQDLIAGFLNETIRRKPSLVVDSSGRGVYENHFGITSPSIDGAFARLRTEYVFVKQFGKLSVYAHRDRLDEHCVVQSTFEVYIQGRTVGYRKSDCTPADTRDQFFWRVEPKDRAVLPASRRMDGFEIQGFGFDETGRFDGSTCFMVRRLPDYPILSVQTGQYAGDQAIWQVELPVGSGNGLSCELSLE